MDPKSASLLAFNWLMIVVALVFLCMRAWVRVIQRKRPNLSDAFVLVSWMAYACNGIIFTLLTILQFDLSSSKQNTSNVDINATPDKLVQVLKLFYGAYVVYPTVLWFTKASILAFYYQLFPFHKKGLRLALHVCTAFNIASFAVAVGMSCFFCQPIASNWSLDPATQCVNSTNLKVFYSFAITNILCDVSIFMLPFSLLRQVRITRRQFWGLCLVFALGGVTIITSIARTVAIAVVADTTQVVVWSVLESGVGIIVACCPALRFLLRKAGETFGSRSRSGENTNGTGMRKQTSDMEASSNVSYVDEFPLVNVGPGGNEIIKQIDFQVTVTGNGNSEGSDKGSGNLKKHASLW